MNQKVRAGSKLRAATIIYWFLLVYVIAALIWWYISLQNQNHASAAIELKELNQQYPQGIAHPQWQAEYREIQKREKRRTAKFTGEGITFLAITLLGALFVYRAVKKQFKLNRQQQNFIMAVTHELKTPIATGKLSLQTLQKRQLTDEQRQKLIDNGLWEMERLNDLVSNILVVSQIESGGYQMNQEVIHLSEITRQAIAEFQQRAQDRKIESRIDPDLFTDGDALLLSLVIRNLIDNALKYSPKDKTVWVELTNSKGPVLKVTDEGSGITREDKKRIFDKFYRTGNEATRTTQGTGLGLYLCKKILTDHGAGISVTDHTPNGAIFTIIFPRHDANK
jgi:two-component system, OmpR family, sensor histidine kinase CiaH